MNDRRYLYAAIICTVLGLLCFGLIGCTNPVTGPDCQTAKAEKVQQWTQINGRLVLITVWAPKMETCQ
jgi:hypothetical protein